LSPTIKFGTDGWRARIAEDFTFDNVRRVTQALIEYLGREGAGVAVGYDNRFQSEDFARIAAEVSAGCGVKTYLSSASLPSPVLSFFVKSQGLKAGIMITASHNPPEWNGFKIKEAWGGSARPEVTEAVERNLSRLAGAVPLSEPRGLRRAQSSRLLAGFDPMPAYLKHVSSFVDLERIKQAHIKIVVDPMHGSAAGYLPKLLEVEEINGSRDPLFGGVNPEPIPVNLLELISYMKEIQLKFPEQLSVGIVLDGDGDRIGGVDPSGAFISSHHVFSLLLYHLVENKKLSGKVAKTFNISRLVEKQAQKYGLPLEETPIGFKYIADLMLKEKILIGGEESGGMGILGNIPERDGILCALLLLELMAVKRKNLKTILDEIMSELGQYYYDRVDLHTERAQEVVAGLKKSPPREFAGMKIVKVEDLDGLKLNFEDESWILFRPSGTEPLLRIYAEGRGPEQVELLLSTGQKLIRS
jgi:phosphomannomutase